jgi:hypothetical protein
VASASRLGVARCSPPAGRRRALEDERSCVTPESLDRIGLGVGVIAPACSDGDATCKNATRFLWPGPRPPQTDLHNLPLTRRLQHLICKGRDVAKRQRSETGARSTRRVESKKHDTSCWFDTRRSELETDGLHGEPGPRQRAAARAETEATEVTPASKRQDSISEGGQRSAPDPRSLRDWVEGRGGCCPG